MKKAITIILIIIVIILFALLFYKTPKNDLQNQNNNPVTTPSNSETYTNNDYNFSVLYDKSLIATTTFNLNYLALGNWSLTSQTEKNTGLNLVSIMIPGSNEITSGELRIGISADVNDLKNCLIIPQNATSSYDIAINSNNFKYYELNDAATSHYLNAKIYHTIHENKCYALEAIVFRTNPLVYDPPKTEPFTVDYAFAQLIPIINSFKFIN